MSTVPDDATGIEREAVTEVESTVAPSDYDYGPIQTYEISWQTGHVERIRAHQVSWPQEGSFLTAMGFGSLATETRRPPSVHFHGQIAGRWRLVLAAAEADIRTIRLVTDDEPLPSAS